MNNMRPTGNLGIQPIQFSSMGHSGYVDNTGDTSYFLQKRLAQNIAYAAYWEPKTIHEIAEELSVSPLFLEEEVAILEEYGFMDRVAGNKYLTNIYITNNNPEISNKNAEIYQKYAKLFYEKYIPNLIDAAKDLLKQDIYIPDHSLSLLLWSYIPFAFYENIKYFDQK